ncbi:sterol desaturase family protein [Undibacterium sp. RTI2.1]|uniref:sterol desaturase family protein n=1 Tax=unclassified Undibacterium TaxID=2630295 RepID=UPI002AB52A0A|nr:MULTISPECIES: sterol desaturase family protein [unclassified Undibacterium]MDY7539315.1 sterol desaturase family protein [Undibacterium sp. 5I1]MEB0031417.1 sterol desaturase family protein [Undibacterium sp. RTI2.1]MEB0117752.1 sterol desaturase family protein [Undibacterium sp. RTI2.2]MEB0232780.1 sterol desaturase family protein [Undibacterium sp. 10I3]MEB0259532.1 sterol desaturase family protein [Undibacterium sp. 5I1]
MDLLQPLLITLAFVIFLMLEILTGRFKKLNVAKDDWKIEILVPVLLLVLIQPGILFGILWIGQHYYPEYKNSLSFLPWWGMFLILLVADDMTQYWWHRISHTPLLWPLHRVHHSASYMSVRVVYRNNFFYYAMMPGIWISSALIFLGFAKVYLVYVVLKLLVIIGAHSAVRWDEPLYRFRLTRPLMWLLERTISTPATHYAHHAITMDDGIGHYKGNFGNFLFFWDILFKSALITRQYPKQVGLMDDVQYGKEAWYIEVFFPVFKSKRSHSALGKERVIVE